MNQKADKTVSKREQKRCSILEAAARLFMCKGYSCTSMDHIAQDAGVAKQTIYSNFDNKQQLFLGVMGQFCDKKYDILRESYEKGDVLATMENFADSFIDLIGSKDATAMRRLLWTETPTNPELSEMFNQKGPRESHAELVDYFNHQINKGKMTCDCPEDMAYLFINSLVADYMLADMLNLPPARSKERIVKTSLEMLKKMCDIK